MKDNLRTRKFVKVLVMLVFVISLTTSGCGDLPKSPTEPVGGGSPLMSLIVENQSTQTLIVFLYDENYSAGRIEPGGRLTIKNQSMNRGWYPVIAKNDQGEVIFSETYTFMPNDKYHLEEIKEEVYKAVIPPLQNK